MSRNNNTELRNPAKTFFQWSGGDGRIKYYDKETKENVFVDLPFTFLVLDKLITITGYSDEDKSGIWANEIRNTKTDVLTVRTKHGIKKTGYYEEIKTVTGVKFAQSVYIAFYDDEKKLQIGNFKMNGCAVSAWIEFLKKVDIYTGAVKITGAEEGKKGATTFFSPVFEQVATIKPETEEAARKLDDELQDYLTAYLAARSAPNVAPSTDDYIEQRNAELNQFGDEKAQTAAAGANDYGSTYGDHVQKVDDDDIPF